MKNECLGIESIVSPDTNIYYTNRLLKETRSDILSLKILGLSSLRPLSLFNLWRKGKAQWSVLLWRLWLIRRTLGSTRFSNLARHTSINKHTECTTSPSDSANSKSDPQFYISCSKVMRRKLPFPPQIYFLNVFAFVRREY